MTRSAQKNKFTNIGGVFALIAIAVLFAEIVVVYLHNKNYGDRIEISEFERALMVIYMCTIVVASGGVFLGALVTF